MDKKLDIIIGEISKISTELKEFKKEMYSFKTEMYAFRDEMYVFRSQMYAFRDQVYRFMAKTDRNFEELFEVNRYTGNFLQGHENRLIALENSR